MKKYEFHQNKVQLLGIVILIQEIKRKEKKLKDVKTWLKSKFVRDIKVFIKFVNFYQSFIKSFNKIVVIKILHY